MRRQENHQLVFGVAAGLVFEKISEDRNVAEDWDFAFAGGLVVHHQAADDDRLPVRRDHDGIGGAGVNHGRIHAGGDGFRLRRVNLRILRRDNHFHVIIP